MPPKKADAASREKSSSAHASYQEMIIDAIVNLKDRNGSSRPSLKKYVKANNQFNVSDNMFDSLFNKALKNGVEKGIFSQPKGPSGSTKLSKKKAEPKKPAAAKTSASSATSKKAAAPKKAPAAKLEKPETVLTKTKSGRVAKTQKPAPNKAKE